jgi:hypothetical protein
MADGPPAPVTPVVDGQGGKMDMLNPDCHPDMPWGVDEKQCVSGKSCDSGVCLVDLRGSHCASSCNESNGCQAGEHCTSAYDGRDQSVGGVCVKPLESDLIDCLCKTDRGRQWSYTVNADDSSKNEYKEYYEKVHFDPSIAYAPVKEYGFDPTACEYASGAAKERQANLVGQLNRCAAPYPSQALPSGRAFVFLARGRATGQGHTAFAVQTGADYFLYCSIDAKERYRADGSATTHFRWGKGEDNGAWCREGTFANMIDVFKNDRHAKPYTEYRYVTVSQPDLRAAIDTGCEMYDRGYNLVGNNCTDVVWDALTRYGVKDLPLLQRTPVPNRWFDKLGSDQNPSSPQKWSEIVRL